MAFYDKRPIININVPDSSQAIAMLALEVGRNTAELKTLISKVEKMANEFDELNQNWDEFKTNFDKEVQQINDKITELQTAIENQAPPGEVLRIAGEIKSMNDRLVNIIPDAPPPVEESGEEGGEV